MRFAALRPSPAEAARLLPVTSTTASFAVSGDPFDAPYAQRPAGSPDTLVFYQFDHLGNTRLAYRSQGGNSELLHTSDYFPFGKTLRTRSYSSSRPLRYQSTAHLERSEIPYQGIGIEYFMIKEKVRRNEKRKASHAEQEERNTEKKKLRSSSTLSKIPTKQCSD